MPTCVKGGATQRGTAAVTDREDRGEKLEGERHELMRREIGISGL
jgi:hypothetical protein